MQISNKMKSKSNSSDLDLLMKLKLSLDNSDVTDSKCFSLFSKDDTSLR